MSEQPFGKPQALIDGDANWAFDSSTGVDTVGSVPAAPLDSRRLNGFSPLVNDEPAAAEVNYALREALKAATWLAGSTPRLFDTLAEAVAACAVGDWFEVARDTTAARTTTIGPTSMSGTIEYVDTDGDIIVCYQGSGRVTAFDYAGSELWTVVLGVTSNFVRLQVVGGDVYVAFNLSASETLYALDRTDGSVNATYTFPSGTQRAAFFCDGSRVYVGEGADGRDLRVLNLDLTTDTTYTDVWDGVTDAAGAIYTIHVVRDREGTKQVICVGSRNSSNEVMQAFDASDGSSIWSYVDAGADWSNQTAHYASDGETLWQASNHIAGEDVNAWSIDPTNGGVQLWAYSAASEVAQKVVFDGDSLSVSLDDGSVVRLSLDGEPIDRLVHGQDHGGNQFATADGDSVIYAVDETLYHVRRPGLRRRFRRVAATDDNRQRFALFEVTP